MCFKLTCIHKRFVYIITVKYSKHEIQNIYREIGNSCDHFFEKEQKKCSRKLLDSCNIFVLVYTNININ